MGASESVLRDVSQASPLAVAFESDDVQIAGKPFVERITYEVLPRDGGTQFPLRIEREAFREGDVTSVMMGDSVTPIRMFPDVADVAPRYQSDSVIMLSENDFRDGIGNRNYGLFELPSSQDYNFRSSLFQLHLPSLKQKIGALPNYEEVEHERVAHETALVSQAYQADLPTGLGDYLTARSVYIARREDRSDEREYLLSFKVSEDDLKVRFVLETRIGDELNAVDIDKHALLTYLGKSNLVKEPREEHGKLLMASGLLMAHVSEIMETRNDLGISAFLKEALENPRHHHTTVAMGVAVPTVPQLHAQSF
jgi:hypothetical protein